jgi:hypothetical protein
MLSDAVISRLSIIRVLSLYELAIMIQLVLLLFIQIVPASDIQTWTSLPSFHGILQNPMGKDR